jgi:hypothetical protein
MLMMANARENYFSIDINAILAKEKTKFKQFLSEETQ